MTGRGLKHGKRKDRQFVEARWIRNKYHVCLMKPQAIILYINLKLHVCMYVCMYVYVCM